MGTGSGRGSEKGKIGMQMQTVEVVPPSKPKMTSPAPAATGIWFSKSQTSPFLYRFIWVFGGDWIELDLSVCFDESEL